MAETKNTVTPDVQTNEQAPASIKEIPGVDQIIGFWKKYQNYVLIGLFLILGIIAFLIIRGRGGANAQKALTADKALFEIQRYIQMDSFNIALNGDTLGNIGLKNIIKKYKGTPAANEAAVYVGICQAGLGNYNEAIKNLKDAGGFGKQLDARRTMALGDAYAEKGMAANPVNKSDCKEAISYYKKAADAFADDADNTALYLWKAAHLHDAIDEKDKAKEIFTTIKEKYPKTTVGLQVDKYLGKLGVEN
jgi:tetratricopeptide (TPR) repeat protein